VRVAVVVGARGVVFGDIGTSPIYTIQTVFNPADPHPVPIGTDNVYAVVSLIFWSVTIIVTLTYISLVMRADNDGEGTVKLVSGAAEADDLGVDTQPEGPSWARCRTRVTGIRRRSSRTACGCITGSR